MDADSVISTSDSHQLKDGDWESFLYKQILNLKI